MADIRKALNVFAQSVVAGQIAELTAAGPGSQTVILDENSVETLLPAYPIKLVTGDSEVPLVELAVPGTDDMYGLVIYNPKQSSFTANELFQVTTRGTVMYLTSSGVLPRSTKVGLDPTTYELIPATNSNYIGRLLDEAETDEIARVELDIPVGVASTSGD